MATATVNTVTVPAAPLYSGQAVVLTATIVPTPTLGGTVTFHDGITTLGTGTTNGAGVATFSTSSLAIGPHAITAFYPGDVTFAPSVSLPVALLIVGQAPKMPGYPVVFSDLVTTDGTTYRGGYCTVADVLLLFTTFPAMTQITSVIVETLIADVSQDLDQALELLYVVPVTGTNAIQHVNFMTKHMAAAAVHELIALNQEDEPEKHLATAVTHHEKGSQRLDDVIRGVTQFFDAVTRAGGERPAFPASIAAGWNPDQDPYPQSGAPLPQDTAPLFGVKRNNVTADIRWTY